MRVSDRAQAHNLTIRTRVKTARRKFMESVDVKDAELATANYKMYCSVLDKAAKTKVIKKNCAIRRKTRAANMVRALGKEGA